MRIKAEFTEKKLLYPLQAQIYNKRTWNKH